MKKPILTKLVILLLSSFLWVGAIADPLQVPPVPPPKQSLNSMPEGVRQGKAVWVPPTWRHRTWIQGHYIYYKRYSPKSWVSGHWTYRVRRGPGGWDWVSGHWQSGRR